MTAPYYSDDQVTLYHGDCLEVLATLPADSVDAVVTDPPYGLEFMGRAWDSFKPADAKIRTRVDGRTNGAAKSVVSTPEAYRAGEPFQQWCTAWATECLRILKPGGHLLSFGGSRTWHRLAAGIEDAGFEIRDSIAWLYGSGFPKSLDVSKAIDKAAGAERSVVGTKLGMPGYSLTDGNGHHRTYGRGLGNTGSGAAECEITAPATDAASLWQGWGTALKPAFEPIVVARKPLSGTVAANVLEHGTGALNIDACRIPATGGDYAHPGNENRRQTTTAYGKFEREGRQAPPHESGRWPTNVVLDEDQAAELDQQAGNRPSGGSTGGTATNVGLRGNTFTRQRTELPSDNGGASRFFPVFRYEAKAPTSERPSVNGTAHPTVKPLDLMRWLVRLVTPPNGVVLEPFAGSGTTAEACIHEHMRCIAIERESDYLPLITARLTKPIAVGFDFGSTS